MLNYLQRLILALAFNAFHTARFSSFRIPVETFTTPDKILSGSVIHIIEINVWMVKNYFFPFLQKYPIESGSSDHAIRNLALRASKLVSQADCS